MLNCFLTIKFLIFFAAFISEFVSAETVSENGIKNNFIKLFHIHQKSNSPKSCTGIALNEKYFITTQICAAQTMHGHTSRILHQKNNKITGDITPNKRFTVGWNNNIAVGKFKQPIKSIKNFNISKNDAIIPGTMYELIGFKNYSNTEMFHLQVEVKPPKFCETAKFETNKYFKFHKETQICGEIITDDLSTLNYGSTLIDKNRNEIIGILSIMKHKKPGKFLAVFTKLSLYCDFIFSETNETFLCS